MDILRSRCSAKLARWAYRNCSEDAGVRIESLRAIATDSNSPWSKKFLWNELMSHHRDDLGDWIVMILSQNHNSIDDIPKYIQLYENSEVHPSTRGCSLFALSYIVEGAKFRGEVCNSKNVQEVCLRALNDADNPYARAGAVWLANQLEMFTERCEELLHDEAVCHDSWTVRNYAEMVLEK